MINPNQLRIAILFSIASISLNVSANGINPPRPAGGTILEATCTDRSSKTSTVLQRVRVLTNDPEGRIQFKIPPSSTVGIKLSDVRSIEIQSTTANADGFTIATVDLLTPKYKGKAAIKLGKGAASLRLTGFNESKERAQIVVATCQTLKILDRTATSEPSKSEAKK